MDRKHPCTFGVPPGHQSKISRLAVLRNTEETDSHTHISVQLFFLVEMDFLSFQEQNLWLQNLMHMMTKAQLISNMRRNHFLRKVSSSETKFTKTQRNEWVYSDILQGSVSYGRHPNISQIHHCGTGHSKLWASKDELTGMIMGAAITVINCPRASKARVSVEATA